MLSNALPRLFQHSAQRGNTVFAEINTLEVIGFKCLFYFLEISRIIVICWLLFGLHPSLKFLTFRTDSNLEHLIILGQSESLILAIVRLGWSFRNLDSRKLVWRLSVAWNFSRIRVWTWPLCWIQGVTSWHRLKSNFTYSN